MENEFDSMDASIKRTMFTICSGLFFAMAAQIVIFVLAFVAGTIITLIAVRLVRCSCL